MMQGEMLDAHGGGVGQKTIVVATTLPKSQSQNPVVATIVLLQAERNALVARDIKSAEIMIPTLV
jgi:hypothetical protein